MLTANEGDARDYSAFSKQVRLGTSSTTAPYVLGPTAFPNANLLKNNNVLGRLNVTNKLGDTDGDGDFDEIYAYGGRSFSIYNAATGAEVHGSGNLLERLTATNAAYGALFNASNGYTEAPTRKNRSDDKGARAGGVTTGRIGTTLYAFVSMERAGGVAVFNINDPVSPVLEAYANNRSLTAAGTGDLGPEGIVFIAAADSPTGQPLLANEVSSTVAVYSLTPAVVTATRPGRAASPLSAYPNPSQGGAVRLSRPVAGALCDLTGRAVRQFGATNQPDTSGVAASVHVLRATDGATTKLVLR